MYDFEQQTVNHDDGTSTTIHIYEDGSAYIANELSNGTQFQHINLTKNSIEVLTALSLVEILKRPSKKEEVA